MIDDNMVAKARIAIEMGFAAAKVDDPALMAFLENLAMMIEANPEDPDPLASFSKTLSKWGRVLKETSKACAPSYGSPPKALGSRSLSKRPS